MSILIPSWNNPQFLNPCIESIRSTGVLNGLCKLVIINNGQQPIKDYVKGWPNTEVLEPKENLGWERGLELGMKHTDSPFVVFQNDDTHLPHASQKFYYSLLSMFNNDKVAAVGPETTTAAGWHSTYQRHPLHVPSEVSFLIFFTVMLRRDYYDEVGGLDTTCPGGDDLDLSIRLRAAGKKLIVNPNAFIIHHGFKSGERLRGGSDVSGGWNSKEMTDKTNQFLIRKHGFKNFTQTLRGLTPDYVAPPDKEGDLIRSLVSEGSVLELGCGGQKTVEHSVGVDRVPKGELIPHLGKLSVADIVCDVSGSLDIRDEEYDVIIARHIFEHCVDSVATILEWGRVLKSGGLMIIAVPNENVERGIPMNPEHVHAFTPESLRTLMSVCGFREFGVKDPKNGVSFIGIYQKVESVSPLKKEKELEPSNA